MRHIIPISGKDSLATAIVQMRKQPSLDYEYLFNSTGMELPEVDAWLDLASRYLGKSIERIGSDLEAIMYEQKILPSHKARYCTRLAKIFPMEDWVGTDAATVYYGIRADEHRTGYVSMAKQDIAPRYPLKEEGYTLPMVWQLVASLDLLPPQFFWQSMYEMVCKRLGSIADDLLANFAPWECGVLFAWRSRPNCHHCYNQRLYEFVGLLEHHPDLFWHDAEIENDIGNDHQEKPFTFLQHWPLARIAEKAAIIKRKRCIAICKIIGKRAQMSFDFEDEGELQEDSDTLDIMSCGLFCGK